MASPTEPTVIVVETGVNTLAQSDQGGMADELKLTVAPGAALSFQNTIVTIGTGARLELDETSVNLSQPQSSGIARPVIDTAKAVLRGTNAELALTITLFRDKTISLNDGINLSVMTRGAPSGFLDITLRFEGNNLISFEDGQSAIRGSDLAISDMNVVVSSRTTRFVGGSSLGTDGGLRASFITKDSGTLDLHNLSVNDRTTLGLT